MNTRSTIVLLLIAVVILGSGPAVQGDVIKDVLYGLGYTGFSTDIQYDYLQDGWTFDTIRTFEDYEFDFGNVELNVTGVVEGSASFSQRGIPEVELSLHTPGLIVFDLVEYDGINKVEVNDGILNVDQDIKINKYGFYDIQMHIWGRGDLVSEGPLAGTQPFDFDLGPIDVRGHWLVDVVNLTLGRAFGFVLPGGAADQIVMGYFDQAELADQILAGVDAAPAGIAIAQVPEPATMLVLVMGIPALLHTHRRR